MARLPRDDDAAALLQHHLPAACIIEAAVVTGPTPPDRAAVVLAAAVVCWRFSGEPDVTLLVALAPTEGGSGEAVTVSVPMAAAQSVADAAADIRARLLGGSHAAAATRPEQPATATLRLTPKPNIDIQYYDI